MNTSENAALYSFASLAADFVLTPETWPVFRAWSASQEDVPEWTDADHEPLEHLADHLRDFAAQACAEAGIS